MSRLRVGVCLSYGRAFRQSSNFFTPSLPLIRRQVNAVSKDRVAMLEEEAAKHKRLNAEHEERSRVETSKVQEVIKALKLQLVETQNKFYEEVATNVCVKQDIEKLRGDMEKLRGDDNAKVTQFQASAKYRHRMI